MRNIEHFFFSYFARLSKLLAVALYLNSCESNLQITQAGLLRGASGTVEAPTFSLIGGTYEAGTQLELTTKTLESEIYYTTDGETPSVKSTKYNAPINLQTSQSIKAFAVQATMQPSTVVKADYVIVPVNYGPVSEPVATPDERIFNNAVSVTLSTIPLAATIYYSTDGSAPSILYTGAIELTRETRLKAKASLNGYTDSTVMDQIFSFKVADPVFSIPQGTYGPSQTVLLSSATTGATVHYTTDGTTEPSCNSTSGPLTVSELMTVKAVGCKVGYTHSEVVSANYTINGAVDGGSTTVAGVPAPIINRYAFSGGHSRAALSSQYSALFAGDIIAAEWQKKVGDTWVTIPPASDSPPRDGDEFYEYENNAYYGSFGPFQIRVRVTTASGVSDWSAAFNIPLTYTPQGTQLDEVCDYNANYNCCATFADGNGGEYGSCGGIDSYGTYPPAADNVTSPNLITDPASSDYGKFVLGYVDVFDWGGSPGSRKHEIRLNGVVYQWNWDAAPPTFSLPYGVEVSWEARAISAGGSSGWWPQTFTPAFFPTAPASVNITGDGLEFPGANNNGSAITNYIVEYSTDNGTTWTTVERPASSADTWTYSGLTPGVEHIFRVKAVNGIGEGPYARSNAAWTPSVNLTSPNLITDPASPDYGEFVLGYLDIFDWGGSPGSRKHEIRLNGVVYQWNWDAAPPTFSLPYGVEVSWEARAISAGGSSGWWPQTFTPAFFPTAPASVNITGDGLEFPGANNNGSAITNYIVEYSTDNGTTWTTVERPASSADTWTYSGLTPGVEHIFRVKAVNGIGEGPYAINNSRWTPSVAQSYCENELVKNPQNVTRYSIPSDVDSSVADETASAGNFVWLAYRYNSNIEKRDILTGDLVSSISLPGNEGSPLLLKSGDYIWAFSGIQVWRIHRTTNAVTTFSPMSATVYGGWSSDGYIWLSTLDGSTPQLIKLNGTSGATENTVDLSGFFTDGVYGISGDASKIALTRDNKLVFLDKSTLGVLRTVNLPNTGDFQSGLLWMLIKAGDGWFMGGSGGRLYRYDYETDTGTFLDVTINSIEGWEVDATGFWITSTHSTDQGYLYHVKFDGTVDRRVALQTLYGIAGSYPKVQVAPGGKVWISHYFSQTLLILDWLAN